ncbi:MAG: adenylate/guanylate cyclase domain-containing protein [Reyranella sp.]|uniref:CHASE2 domain-containing protein n=1 Tax=Reyranella sp. TaxID=1929291 RepID=UPI001AC32912|nr:adenylate/guanylate cyclase domain-containing protein [Reyranella sp.]MBN9087121.1 adenylate/guanylate cyclase domain-containing protein [Reyranella sp.]
MRWLWRWLFGGDRAPRAPILVALLVLLNALLLRIADPPVLNRLRDIAFDNYQRLKPRERPADIPVRIVDIDEAALAEYGQWPWPRTLLATLIEKLAEKGAAVIAFDVVFAEPDRTSLGQMVKGLPDDALSAELRLLAEKAPDNDRIFAAAIKDATVITGFGFDAHGGSVPPRRFAGVAHNTGEQNAKSVSQLIAQFIPQQTGAVKTIDVLESAAQGGGSVTTEVDSAIVREVPMLFRLAGQRDEDLFPALSIETLRVVQGASTYLVRWSGAQGFESFGARTGVGAIRVGNASIDTDAHGRVALYDTGHLAERFVSARDVLKGAVPAEKIDSHIVFVGTSAVGLKDLRNTPLQSSVPGVEIHAQIVEQILSQNFLERPDYADGAEFLYLAAIGLVFVILIPRLKAATMFLVAALFVAIGIAVPWLAFTRIHLLFDPIYPPVTLAAIYITGSALSFMRAERDRREIRGAFNLYLSPDQVEAVVRNPELLALGGEQREITVMFTDVRGFTRISEQFDPQGLTRFMNRLLTPMTGLIQERRGTIDKYMGDAIMAFWNAPVDVPNHAQRACETSLAMQARLVELNAEWRTEAEAEGRPHIPVAIGIGLNTGQATVGNFGSTQRLQYSCLGDEVNLASRLEGLCKTYAVGIVVGENTWRQASEFAMIELDLVMVKGKTEPERICALAGDASVAARPAFKTLVDRQEAFLILYRTGAFSEALSVIAECAEAAQALGWRQGYYEMMRERVDGLIDDSPPDWNGVYVATEK